MSTIAVCVLAKNEERILEKCLQSIFTIADEIIFIDTGSTDKTIDIATKYTSKIFYQAWNDDFASMYNLAFSKSTADYCMLWDADFVLQENSSKRLNELKKADFENADQVSLKWNTQFDNFGNVTAFVYRPLIFKAGKFTWKYPTHSIAFPTNQNTVKTVYPNIEVDHKFDINSRTSVTKKHNDIVLNYLQKYPKDPYMSFALLEECFTLEEYHKVIETGGTFIKSLQSFPFPIQLLELLFFSYLRIGDLTKGIKTITDHKLLFFHKSRKYDILYADSLLYSDFEQAVEVYKYTLSKGAYTMQQDDEYDINRLNHALELSKTC
jgi:glycosyltransferase involved in cell wall biosynthesis